jgi:hypothetical protein
MPDQTITVDQYGITTGENDIKLPIVMIFPNPANNTLNMNGLPENTKVSIYDSQGRLVVTCPPDATQIDISELTKGIYMMKIVNKSGTSIKKFVKQ